MSRELRPAPVARCLLVWSGGAVALGALGGVAAARPASARATLASAGLRTAGRSTRCWCGSARPRCSWPAPGCGWSRAWSPGTPPAGATHRAAACRCRSAGWCWRPAAPRSPAAWRPRRTPLPASGRPRARPPSPGCRIPDRATVTMHVSRLMARQTARGGGGPGPPSAPAPPRSWSGPGTPSGPGRPDPRARSARRRDRRPVAADLPRQPRRHRRRPRPDPARPAAAPAARAALRGVPMSPFHEKVVPLRAPVPVASVQGTLALDLHPAPRPAGARPHAERPAGGRRGADRRPRCVAGSSSGRTATPRPPSRSSAATGRSPSCCAGPRARSTTTSPAGRSWSPAPSATGPGRAGSSRCARRCSACTPASSPATPPRSARTCATASAPAPSPSASSSAASAGSASPSSLPDGRVERRLAREARASRRQLQRSRRLRPVISGLLDAELGGSRRQLTRAVRPVGPPGAPWHFLNFLPEPQGHRRCGPRRRTGRRRS